MSAVAVLRPAYPRCYCHLVVPIRDGRLFLVELADFSAHGLLDALTHQLLVSVELVAHIVQCSTVLVISVICNGEHLIISLDGQLQPVIQIAANGMECLVQVILVVCKEYDVVCILCSMERLCPSNLYVKPFIHPVHEV